MYLCPLHSFDLNLSLTISLVVNCESSLLQAIFCGYSIGLLTIAVLGRLRVLVRV